MELKANVDLPNTAIDMIYSLGDFIGADKIEYIDGGQSETYVFEKNGKIGIIDANATNLNGAWITFRLEDKK